MARKILDQTGNESLDITLSKINDMTEELYEAPVVSGLSTTETLKIATGTKTATATAGAATLNKASGKVTSEALTTAAAALYTLTITNSEIAAADIVLASVANGTNNQGATTIVSVTPAAGSVVIVIRNSHASQALNGTIVVSFVSFKA